MGEVFIGTVIANSDISDTRNTQALGRVLVMIRNKSDIDGSEMFSSPYGQNLCSKMSPETLNRLKKTEVWAYVLQPNSGGAQSSYNPGSDIARPSNDSSDVKSLNKKAPAAGYSGLLAAGNDNTDPGSSAVNTTDNNFAPDNRDGAVKGTFSIPPIGATVAIMFVNGNRGLPVVVGTLMGAEAVNSIHSTDSGAKPSYPGVTQGIPGPSEQQPVIGTGGSRPIG